MEKIFAPFSEKLDQPESDSQELNSIWNRSELETTQVNLSQNPARSKKYKSIQPTAKPTGGFCCIEYYMAIYCKYTTLL